MRLNKNILYLDKTIDRKSYKALKKFVKDYSFTFIGRALGSWKKNQEVFVIDSHNGLDKESYEALISLSQDYGKNNLSELLKEWIDYTAYDFAAWYIGDEI